MLFSSTPYLETEKTGYKAYVCFTPSRNTRTLKWAQSWIHKLFPERQKFEIRPPHSKPFLAASCHKTYHNSPTTRHRVTWHQPVGGRPAILSFRTTLPFLFTRSPTRRVVKHRHFDWTTSKFLGHVDASLWSDIRGWWGHRVRGSDRLANRTPPPLISGACDVRLTRWDLVYTPDASPTSLPLFLPSFQQVGLRSTEWMFPPKSMDTSNAKLNYICRLSIGKG